MGMADLKGFQTRYSIFSPSFSPSTEMRFSPYTLSPAYDSEALLNMLRSNRELDMCVSPHVNSW